MDRATIIVLLFTGSFFGFVLYLVLQSRWVDLKKAFKRLFKRYHRQKNR